MRLRVEKYAVVALLGALAGSIVAFATAGAAGAATSHNTLSRGAVLRSGARLTSQNRCFAFVMQRDGNAVEYGRGNAIVWSTSTQGHPGAFTAMQRDGNLVVYSRESRPLWSSNTNGHANAAFVLQNDGNAVVYARGTRAVFWEGTTGGCAYSPSSSPSTDSSRAEAAIQWMQQHAGSSEWDGRCERAVALAFARIDHPALPSAHADWLRFPVHHTDTNPPRGALVFWATSANWHVGISLGNGNVVSTSSKQFSAGLGRGVGVSPLVGYFAPYEGWTANGF